MSLPLETKVRYGLMTRMWDTAATRHVAAMLDRLDMDSLWVGDHIAFTVPTVDPLMQLLQAATHNTRLTVGTAVYLLPLRQPALVAKQVASLDHLTDGRFVFGVGVGGEFPKEYELAGVPRNERGARLTESVELIRKLWTGEKVSHKGRFFSFDDIAMTPKPVQPGGPPIWFGGRSDAALARTGRLGDGYLSYVISPDMFRQALAKIEAAADAAEREITRFSTAHLLFTRIDDSYEKALDTAAELLSKRYAMDFRKAAERYCALGTPAQVAERLREFHAAGVRWFNLDFLGSFEERDVQLERFCAEARPLLKDLG